MTWTHYDLPVQVGRVSHILLAIQGRKKMDPLLAMQGVGPGGGNYFLHLYVLRDKQEKHT